MAKRTSATLFTLGYGRWEQKRRVQGMMNAMQAAGVTTLVDIRHSPCASNPKPSHPYGPRAWHLQSAGHGLERVLVDAGIDYRWLVELGNPLKTKDPELTLLRSHLEDPAAQWPINRGLVLLRDLIKTTGTVCALLCACKSFESCHRKLIAEAVNVRFFAGRLLVQDLA